MYFYNKRILFIGLILILILMMCCNIYTRETFQIRDKTDLECDNLTTDWDSKNDWDTKDPPDTKKIISESDREMYYSLLKDIDEILTEHHIKYVLISGSLLGSYRHGDIIPWDDDADICIRYEDHDSLMKLQNEFTKRGIYLSHGCLSCWSGFYSDVCEYINTRSKTDKQYEPIPMIKPCQQTRYFAAFKKGNVHVDVFHLIPIYDKDNKKMYTINGNNRLISEEQANKMFDTIKCPFGPLELNCPSNTKELLCYAYDNNLQSPTLKGIENKSLIPGMWSGKDNSVSYFMKDDEDNYIIKNYK